MILRRLSISWALLAPLAACGGPAAPGEAAIAEYLARHASPGSPSASTAAPAPQPARRIAVTVERGEGIPDLDPGPGESDPYLVLEYEGARFRSSTVEGSANPVWGDTFMLDVRPGAPLIAKLYDEDFMSSDELLGTLTVALPRLTPGEEAPLVLAFRGGERGTVTLTLVGVAAP